MTQYALAQNHYKVLSLPSILDSGQAPTANAIKSAYHRALLVHHPDKSSVPSSTRYTIDQITLAYQVLIDPISRASFDKDLRLDPQNFANAKGWVADDSASNPASETFDLDDLIYDDDNVQWYRGCRCGQERAFVVTEKILENSGGEEAFVGCTGCSLWIRVLFALDEG